MPLKCHLRALIRVVAQAQRAGPNTARGKSWWASAHHDDAPGTRSIISLRSHNVAALTFNPSFEPIHANSSSQSSAKSATISPAIWHHKITSRAPARDNAWEGIRTVHDAQNTLYVEEDGQQ